MTPTPIVQALLRRAYDPCVGFAGACASARWNPSAGHVPRGFCGAVGDPEEVCLVLVCAEPGDPHVMESHIDDGTAAGRLSSASMYAWECFAHGKDQFHRNVRELLGLCWPKLTFGQQMRKTWITDSVLCSASKECGPVERRMERECATRYLVPQLREFRGAIVVALGRKAEKRLRRAGISDIEYAYSVAPPGCNHKPARASWERIASLVRDRFANE